jgi:hypothetical protein
VDFLHFWPSKIRVSPTGVVFSFSPPQCRLSSSQHRHTDASCHAYFSLSQDELATSASSSGNTLFRRLPSRAETKASNSHHSHRLPSLDRSTPTLHHYKKIISNLATLSTTQSRFILPPSLTEHHIIIASSTVVILFHCCLTPTIPPHNDTHIDKLAGPLLLSEQLISM